MTKRVLDCVFSAAILVVLSPLLLLIGLVVALDSPGPPLYTQERIGLNFQPFRLFKFRTMHRDADRVGPLITAGGDPRVTRVGAVLRTLKLDELPQFLNVLRGDMSIVGPRPEVGRYVEMFREDFADILRARPGITDLASVKYRNEATLLARAADPEELYVREVLPAKIALAKSYVARSSLALDAAVVLRTLLSLLDLRRTP